MLVLCIAHLLWTQGWRRRIFLLFYKTGVWDMEGGERRFCLLFSWRTCDKCQCAVLGLAHIV